MTELRWRKSSHSTGSDDCIEVAHWRKSSHSTGDSECVEVAHWRKSSRSTGSSECVEVALIDLGAVRDSKNPAGPMLKIDLTALLSAVKGNHLDR